MSHKIAGINLYSHGFLGRCEVKIVHVVFYLAMLESSFMSDFEIHLTALRAYLHETCEWSRWLLITCIP
jgi:hypothetical protein